MMSNEALNGTLQKLKESRDELEHRLLQSDEYRAFVAIDRLIQDLLAKPNAKRISQTEAAYQVLCERGHPMRTPELLTLAKSKGAVFGSKAPVPELCSVMSRNRQFRSVLCNGRRCWWLTDRQFPAETGPAKATKKRRAVKSKDELSTSPTKDGALISPVKNGPLTSPTHDADA